MKKCTICGKNAIIDFKYGHAYCREHFLYIFEKRIKRLIRKDGLIGAGEKLLLAMAGNLDSCVLAYVIKKIFSESNEIEAIMIDEGIKGFSKKRLCFGKKTCKGLGIKYNVRKVKNKIKNCLECKKIKKKLIEKHSRKILADKILFGYNLDDAARDTLMKICDIGKDWYDWIKPMCLCQKEEIELYAKINGIKFYAKSCPLEKKDVFSMVVGQIEEKYPGTRFGLAKALIWGQLS